MAKLRYASLVGLWLLLAACHRLSLALRHGEPSATLHERRPDRSALAHVPISVTADDHGLGNGPGHVRRSRAVPTTTTAAASESIRFNASVFTLNDSHTQLLVHWGGQGSNAIIILAKNNDPKNKSGSSVYISYDRGRTFQDKTSQLTVSGSPAIIDKFVNSPIYSSHYIFMDVVNKSVYTTTDYGRNFQHFQVPFTPDEIFLHITNEKILLGMDKNDTEKKLWLSEDFGETWNVMQMHVKAFYWGVKGIDSENELFVQRLEPSGISSLLKSPDFFKSEFKTQLLINGIEDFQVQGKYIFATKKEHLLGAHSHNNTLQLWVSYNRNMFHLARFPDNKEFKIDFFVADASDDQVFLCVNHRDMFTNLYISDVTGVHYALSLERIFYYNPEGPGKDTWISFITKNSFADFHKVAGLKGIYIASQLKTKYHLGGLSPEDLVTMITFDSGGEWQPVAPPLFDQQGNPLKCKLSENCSLHLTQRFSQLYPITRSVPIQSRSSAIGIIIASGTLGKSLKGHPAVFLSTDAGISWHKILDGNYFYAIGDHGGVITAVQAYNGEGPTNQLLYSINEGETWHNTTISDFKIRVYGLMTEPGERSTVFTMFGSRPEKHQWQIITVDLRPAFKHVCTAEDYKRWSPGDVQEHGHRCLLGKEEQFRRRLASSECYNGEEFERGASVNICSCRQEDFECDEGYLFNYETKKCQRDPEMSVEDDFPYDCQIGMFYNRSRGYRKIAGNECEGGLDNEFNPVLTACPFPAEREFILFSQRKSINRILLNRESQIQTLPIPNLSNVIALEYDFRNNCVYWADIDDDVIMRLCLDGKSEPEILVETNLSSVEGLALDWISNNLYFVDGEQGTIEVIRIDVPHTGHLRRTVISNTTIEKPRGIALMPDKGYLFFTVWGPNKASISRASLDGNNLIQLISYPNVHWPNGISIDYNEQRIYWVDAKLNYVACADLDGKNVKKLIEDSFLIPHPFAIGIFKEWMYWDDWKRNSVLMANKFTGVGIEVFASQRQGVMDLKVFDRSFRESMQSGVCKPGNNSCKYLCMALPGEQHVCKCPDGFNTANYNGNETCLCESGFEMLPNGTCKTSNKCGPNQFQCKGGKFCIAAIWKCDGDEDCDDQSDEADCESRTCNENEFTCNNKKCISAQWRCDTDKDCDDGSDEKDCHYMQCNREEFACSNGRCINKRWACDQDNDCLDNSDEANCTSHFGPHNCPLNEFRCDTGDQCLLHSWKCDGDIDCQDGSDEKNCTDNACQPWQFKCNSGNCIFRSWQCDGDNDCPDHSDEVNCSNTTVRPSFTPLVTPITASYNCSPWTFTCKSSQCIPLWWRCDNVVDCSDGSDELGCFNSTTTSTTSIPVHQVCRENHFRCNNDDCIWEAWVCDGEADCSSGEDEADCLQPCGDDHFRCVHSAGCISFKDVCNGHQDCADNSDEKDCSMPTIPHKDFLCDHTMFECKTGFCISLDKRCDGEDNCFDGSDETGCVIGSHEYFISSLEVDTKTTSKHSFSVSWSPPHHLSNNISLEYMPSISEANSNTWANESWSNATLHVFTQLKPYTLYNVTVYVRVAKSHYVSPPITFATVKTSSDIPSPPRNLSLRSGATGHSLEWLPPLHPNGIIDGYRVYMVPPNPPHYEEVMGGEKTNLSLDDIEKIDISENFKPGTNHTFWVTAVAQEMESNSSNKVLLIDKHTLLTEYIEDLEAKQIGNVTVVLDWKPFNQSVDDYVISIIGSVKLYKYENLKVKNPPCTVTGLSPDTVYTFKVIARKGMARCLPTELQIRTIGDSLQEPRNLTARIFNNGSVYLSWEIPNDKRNADWDYGIQYGLSMNDVLKQGIKARTQRLNHMVNGLQHCEYYVFLIRVVAPYGVGPPSNAFGVKTAFNPRAKPAAVTVSPPRSLSVTVSWKASCTIVTTPVAYKVLIKDLIKHSSSWSQTLPTKNAEVTLPLQLAKGGRYSVQVQTADSGSVLSEPVTFTGPLIAAPHQLKLGEVNGRWELKWDVTEVPANMSYSFVVLVSENENDFSSAREYETNDKSMMLDMLNTGYTFYVAVKLKDQEGYASELSEKLPFLNSIDKDSIVLKPYTVVSIIAPVVIIVIALAAAFTFLLVRHKRLRRATLSFANSHYNTRSGATTFTTGDELDDEDSPMIRGFSDDEPLVIA